MRKLLLLIAITAFAIAFAIAQEPSLKPSMSAPKAEAATVLSLEVEYNATLPPAYISVRGTETKPPWIWVTRFARTPGALPAPDALPIQAVRVESQFNGETADVRISLLRGREGFEKEDPVAVYHLGVDEKRTVTELKSFGVEPINLTLLNVVPPLPPAPAFENRTKSVEIISVESENVPLPAYKLTLRNLSEKNVRAVKIELISDGRLRGSTFWQSPFDRPLIEASGVVEKSLSAVITQRKTTAYAPGV